MEHLKERSKNPKETIIFLKYILLIILLQLSHFFFSTLFPSAMNTSSHLHSLLLSSCSWVIHMSSLASPFPILFLTSRLFCTYYLFLIPCIFSSILSLPLPTGNPPCDLHFCNSSPVLVVCLVCLCFCF